MKNTILFSLFRQVYLKSLKTLQQRYRSNLSETGSKFSAMWLLLSSWRQHLMHLLWIVCSLILNFLCRFGYQAEQDNQNRFELKHYTRVVLDMVLNICFFSVKGFKPDVNLIHNFNPSKIGIFESSFFLGGGGGRGSLCPCPIL